MKKRSVWSWFDSFTKRVAAAAAVLTILTGAGWQTYSHFAKAAEVAEIRIRLDKQDLYETQRQIFDLERTQAQRPLTNFEARRLQELRQREQEVLDQIRRQQK